MAGNTVKNRIKRIQRHFGVPADGLVGPTTLTAIENALFDDLAIEEAAAHHALTVSREGLKMIVRHEISSPAYYRRALSQPIWPGGGSGVTIGIGYDLGYHHEQQIRKDWSGKLSEIDLEKLIVVAGLKGLTAMQALKGVQSVSVPFESARDVFYESTLGRYAARTANAYPGVADLFPDAQAGLLSLVYNRGAAMTGARRKEMAAIRALVVQQDYEGIAQQIRSMKRLWEGKRLPGLLKRRDDEARLVRQSDRDYEAADLVRV